MSELEIDELEESVMIVVGRDDSIPAFKDKVDSVLLDNFTLKIIDVLEDEVGADKKVRMIGFIVGSEIAQYTFEAVGLRLASEYQFHGVEVLFPDMEAAFTYANSEYGFGQDQMEHLEKLKKVSERYPSATAAEIEQFDVFAALMETNQVRAVRALFTDEPVMLLVKITESEDEFLVSPLAVMVNPILSGYLNFQWEEDDDEDEI